LPSLSVVAKSSHNSQPVSPSLGQPQYPANGRDWSVAVQVNIPLFEGFARTYQVREARAQAELQGVALDQARNQVGLDVWTSYQALQTATQNVGNSTQLLELAQASQQASQDRYVAGVGNILELLNVQSALAVAKRQHLQALTDWRAARLQLAGRLGRLGMWSL
jgi:outer membrane protein